MKAGKWRIVNTIGFLTPRDWLVVSAVIVLLLSITPAISAQRDVHASLIELANRKPAPAFRLTAETGKATQLSDYRGKVVLLNFWATDCGGCVLEIPWLVDIDQSFKNRSVKLIGISMDISYEDLKNAAEAWAKVKPFLETHHIPYRILMGDGEVAKRYDIRALPATYLIDSRGRIAATYIGLIDKQNVEDNINTLLAEQK